ncbi:hypothetical protein [Marinobacter sp.]|uniref:hypothetical protein n=1 Tax=Marinobacter sp. TaxID=50741 RepID=UPI003850D6A2
MKINAFLVFLLLSISGFTQALEIERRILEQTAVYVNLQICSNTYSEYQNDQASAEKFLEVSLAIQREYMEGDEFDQFIHAIQEAHDQQKHIKVYENETREEFYLRVFNDTRCRRELELAEGF